MLTFGELPISPEPGVALYCLRCCDTFSASQGDYFMHQPDEVITHCGRNMQLVRVLPTAHEVIKE